MRATFLPILLVAWSIASSPAASKAAGETGVKSSKSGLKTPGIQVPLANLKAEAEISVSGLGVALAISDSVLIPIESSGSIARIDLKTNKVLEPFAGLKKPCGGVAVAFSSIWAPDCGTGTIVQLEAKSGKPKVSLLTGAGPASQAVAASTDSVWLLSDDKTTLTRIDPQAGAIVGETRLPQGCTALAFGATALWAPCPAENRLLRIDPRTNLVSERIEVKGGPSAVTFGADAVWVLTETEGKVVKIDPKTNKVTETIDLNIPNAKGNLAFGADSVWITAPGFPISRIHAASGKVMQQFAGSGGGAIYFGADSVWLADPARNILSRFDPKRIVATLAE